MIDWISDNGWLVWVGIAVILAVVELLSLDLVLLMFALGALAAGLAAALGAPLWLSMVVFVAVSVALLFFARPPMVHRLHDGPTLTTGHQALVGHDAVVTEPVDAQGGRIRLRSEIWTARADGGEAFDIGAPVRVVSIDGATAVVTAKDKES